MVRALIPALIRKQSSLWLEATAFLLGVAGMALLAQIQFRLPFTPVPVTGQTFGVALIGLTFGAKRATAVMAGYLAAGALGAPVFTLGQSGLVLGPTLGYLVGMLFAASVVGYLADRGFARGFGRALFAAYVGSFIIFTCGLLGLALFVDSENLFVYGLLPFLPGDLLKNIAAAAIASRARKFTE